jgi:hypothetical protein
MPAIARPDPALFGPFGRYMSLIPDGDILHLLDAQLRDAHNLLKDLPEKESLALHAPYMWTVREVIGHITDAERIFAYRALRFARGDATPLPSFDENAYVRAAKFNHWPLPELVADFEHVRRASLGLFHHLAPEALQRTGIASNITLTPAALAYVIAGHAHHHLTIVRQRFGK